jgi:hypothetical protein
MRYRFVLFALSPLSGVGCASVPSSDAKTKAAPPPVLAIDCGPAANVALTEAGVGGVHVGQPVAELRKVCRVIDDTNDLGDEGRSERLLAIRVGQDTVAVTIDSGRVWRINVTSSRLSTADSIHVGVPLGRLLAAAGGVGAEGEGGLYVQVPLHCGLSFRIAYEIGPREHRQDWTAQDLRTIPNDSKVDEILITGCHRF